MVFKKELIQYTAQTISKQDNEYYIQLVFHFNNLFKDKLINQICEYTELTVPNINDPNYIIENILPKIDWVRNKVRPCLQIIKLVKTKDKTVLDYWEPVSDLKIKHWNYVASRRTGDL